MHPRYTHSHNTTKMYVTVTDFPAVQRVLTLLTGRNYQLTRFTAEESGGSRWRASFDVLTTSDQSDLLAERLHRMPSVLLVDVRLGDVMASSA